MNFSHRFFYGPFGLFVALAASVMIYWWYAADALSKRLDAENGREIAPGIHMHFASKRIAGFPFRLDAIFRDFTLDRRAPMDPITWHAQDFATHRLTYDSDKAVMEAAGPQEISWTDEDGKPRSFRFTPGPSACQRRDRKRQARPLRPRHDLGSPNRTLHRRARGLSHPSRSEIRSALDLVADLQAIRFAGERRRAFRTAYPTRASKDGWRPRVLSRTCSRAMRIGARRSTAGARAAVDSKSIKRLSSGANAKPRVRAR